MTTKSHPPHNHNSYPSSVMWPNYRICTKTHQQNQTDHEKDHIHTRACHRPSPPFTKRSRGYAGHSCCEATANAHKSCNAADRDSRNATTADSPMPLMLTAALTKNQGQSACKLAKTAQHKKRTQNHHPCREQRARCSLNTKRLFSGKTRQTSVQRLFFLEEKKPQRRIVQEGAGRPRLGLCRPARWCRHMAACSRRPHHHAADLLSTRGRHAMPCVHLLASRAAEAISLADIAAGDSASATTASPGNILCNASSFHHLSCDCISAPSSNSSNCQWYRIPPSNTTSENAPDIQLVFQHAGALTAAHIQCSLRSMATRAVPCGHTTKMA